jgi:integrase
MEETMPTLKLTEHQIDKLPAPDPSGKQVLYWDSERKGFGVLCSGVTNTKSFIVQRALPDGRNRRVTIAQTNILSLDKARRKAEEMLYALGQGDDPKKKVDKPETLRGTLESYLTARRDLRPASVRLYRQVVEKTLTSWLDKPLREISADMVEERHRAIAASISKGGASNGEVTANVAMRIFRAIYSFAADRSDDMPQNPVRRLKRQWYKEKRRERIVPEERMTEFYNAVCALENAVQRDYFVMLLFTGMRRSECASLRWDDINLDKRSFRVQGDKTKSGVKLELPMSDVVRDMLVARRALGIAGGGFVFPGRGGGCIASTAAPLKAIYEATGIQISAHDLRRGFITIAESTNISPTALKALVNHSMGSDVTEGYVQMRLKRLEEPVQLVADRIKALCGIESVVGGNVKRLKAGA